jgi:uncharacterized protein (DUF736 family)
MMEKAIGALWTKKSAKGQDFLSGHIEIDGKKIKLVVFKNDKEDNASRPDFRIFEAKPMEGQAPRQTTQAPRASADEFTDDIPF